MAMVKLPVPVRENPFAGVSHLSYLVNSDHASAKPAPITWTCCLGSVGIEGELPIFSKSATQFAVLFV